MPDYQNGKIYKIVNNVNDKKYFGSTCQSLSKRIGDHRNKHSKCMSKNLEVDLKYCKIILVEKYPCECKYELEKRERFYIENFECVNKKVPGRTSKEYNQANKDKLKKYKKEWREANKDKIKEYREANKDKIKEYRDKNKDKIKQYYQINKEKTKEKKYKITCFHCLTQMRKDSYTKHLKVCKVITPHKEKKNWAEKITCFHCLKEMRKDSYNRHLKTCIVISTP